MPISASASKLFSEVYDMYDEIAYGASEVCQKCSQLPYWHEGGRNNRIGPVPIYHIGNAYPEQTKKIVFVASVGYGWADHIGNEPLNYADLRSSERETMISKFRTAQNALYYEEQEISIYKAIKLFCEEYFGNAEGFENVALINIINCNRGDKPNTIPADVRRYCANEEEGFHAFQRVLAILRPTIIVGICCHKDEWLLDKALVKQLTPSIKYFGHPSRKDLVSYVQDIVGYVSL